MVAAVTPLPDGSGRFDVVEFGESPAGIDKEVDAINSLDEQMCRELELPGHPTLPAYGREW